MNFKIITEESFEINVDEVSELIDNNSTYDILNLGIDDTFIMLNKNNVRDLIMCLQYKLEKMK
jgi:hypothetical protein